MPQSHAMAKDPHSHGAQLPLISEVLPGLKCVLQNRLAADCPAALAMSSKLSSATVKHQPLLIKHVCINCNGHPLQLLCTNAVEPVLASFCASVHAVRT